LDDRPGWTRRTQSNGRSRQLCGHPERCRRYDEKFHRRCLGEAQQLRGYQTLVSEDSGFQATFFLQKRGNTNTFTFTIPFGAAGGPGVAVYADSGVTPTIGTWYHLAGVYDATRQSASIYVNGVLAAEVYSVSPSPANGHTGIGRGQYNNSYVDWVNGAIDDVRLYQSALTPDEILAIARIGDPSLPGPQPVEPASLDVDGFHPGARINPKFYGLMTEEINHSYDGGIYGELIQNRAFNDDASTGALVTRTG